MTRDEAKAAILAAGGEPSDSAWMKYTVPERGRTYCAFPSRHYSEMKPAELQVEVEAYRARAQADNGATTYRRMRPNPLDGTRLWDKS